MTVNIWSDVRCPFCYIGKRKFEMALEDFEHKDDVTVQWHSFQLDPDIKTNTEINPVEYFSTIKGIPKKQATAMMENVANIAKEVGLEFNMDKQVVANSFKAHKLIQLAKRQGADNDLEEKLFKAHFEEGKNIDDDNVLLEVGTDIGLSEEQVKNAISSTTFDKQVKQDEMQAQSMGVRGVPFFVFNNKYAVSGAQAPETFLEVLNESWKEYEKENPSLIVTEGASCSTDGNCD